MKKTDIWKKRKLCTNVYDPWVIEKGVELKLLPGKYLIGNPDQEHSACFISANLTDIKSFRVTAIGTLRKKGIMERIDSIVKRVMANIPCLKKKRKRKTLGVIIGHTKKSPGARMPNGLTEYDFNSEIACIMASRWTRNLDVAIIHRDGVGIVNAYQHAKDIGCNAVFELHFNSLNGRISGTETITSSDSEDLELAQIVQKNLVNLFRLRDRGNREIGIDEMGGISAHAFQNGPNCIVEPGFGDNPKDADLLCLKRVVYAECLVNSALEYFKFKKGM